MLKEPALVVLYVSPGVAADGGGFYITASGQIKPIPPRDPIFNELTSAVHILAHVGNIKNTKVRNEMKIMAEQTISEASKKILSQD